MGGLDQTPPQPSQWMLVSIYFIELPVSSLCSIMNPSHTAPSAAPISVGESEVTSSTITVQWGPVNCIHINGDITGYSVRYGVQGSGNTQTSDVSGGSLTEATISSLMPSTTYSIQVAAVNSAGIGVYSDPPVIIETHPSKYTCVLCTCEVCEHLMFENMFSVCSLFSPNLAVTMASAHAHFVI